MANNLPISWMKSKLCLRMELRRSLNSVDKQLFIYNQKSCNFQLKKFCETRRREEKRVTALAKRSDGSHFSFSAHQARVNKKRQYS